MLGRGSSMPVHWHVLTSSFLGLKVEGRGFEGFVGFLRFLKGLIVK